MTSTCVVVTSIGSSDLPAIVALDSGCARAGWSFYVVGDAKTPCDYSLSHGEFLARSTHSALPWRLGRSIPDGNYSLKNLGYLQAIHHGHECIVETDDDNIPRKEFWTSRQSTIFAVPASGSGWANFYLLFTEESVWPRGLPLDEVYKRPSIEGPRRDVFSPIQMALADDNPDVDAIYRLVGRLPLTFSADIVVSCEQTWSPFNSQNTTWFTPAFPLLYLPTTCSFRMTDIWRSFVAQAWLQRVGWSLAILSPTVFQIRNDHNLMRDFADEVSGYLHNKQVMTTVTTAAERLPAKPEAVWDYLHAAYTDLAELGLVNPFEVELVEDWAADFMAASETR